jgi:hypothetical protein
MGEAFGKMGRGVSHAPNSGGIVVIEGFCRACGALGYGNVGFGTRIGTGKRIGRPRMCTPGAAPLR